MNKMKTYLYKSNTITTLKGGTKIVLMKDEVVEDNVEGRVKGTYIPFKDSKGRVEDIRELLKHSKGGVEDATVSLNEN